MGIGVGGMEKIGVEAIVDGLDSFLSDMKKMDKSIADVNKPVSALGGLFSGLGNIISGLVSGVFRILEFTLGNLLASAIQSVISKIKELVSETIQAGVEFQILELRLKNLNFNAATESGLKFNEAMAEATKMTKEQLVWLQKLAVQTPYDAQDLANVFTLARSYGFAADESQKLTQDISNFAAGMGLGNQEIERIIVNFGQMVQQGKVSGRELTDLARGAFVPVNDVLKIMQTETGLTGDAFDEFRNSAEGVDSFMRAFSQLVEQRFSSAAVGMARTFKGATDNAKDFIKSVIGLNVVKPILDRIGGGLADFLAAFSETGRFEKITSIATDIGNTLSGIVGDIINMGPSAEGMADKVVKAFEGISKWLTDNREAIVDWVRRAAEWVKTTLIPAFMSFVAWVQDKLIPAIRDDIIPLFATLIPLGAAIAGVFMALFSDTTGAQGFSEFIHATLIPAIQGLTTWINTNKETIAQWIKVLATIYIIVTVAAWVLGFILKLITLVSVIWKVISVVGALVSGMGPLIAVIAAVAVGLLFWKFVFTLIIANAKSFITLIIKYFNDVKNNIVNTLRNIVAAAKAQDWKGVGMAIVDGIVGYVKANIDLLAGVISAAIKNAIAAAKAALQSGSPSKVFEDIGAGTMEGFSIGVKRNTELAVRAMQKAVSQVAMPAFGAPAMAFAGAMAPSSSVNSTTNYNNTLNVQTNARSEPLIADFNMLQSLSGR